MKRCRAVKKYKHILLSSLMLFHLKYKSSVAGNVFVNHIESEFECCGTQVSSWNSGIKPM